VPDTDWEIRTVRTIKLCATPGPRPMTLLEAIRRSALDIERNPRTPVIRRPLADRNTTTASA
jgi:hypothetical protein